MLAAPVLALHLLLLVPQSPTQDSAGRSAALDSAGIQEAMATGRQTKKGYGFGSSAWSAHGLMPSRYDSNYMIYVQGPFGRVATAAAKNARNYQPFTADSVRPEMTAGVLTVLAYPDILVPGGGSEISVSPERVVLQSVTAAGDTVTTQPARMDTVSADYANLFGAKITRSGLVAEFDLRTLPAPPFDIIVVNSVKEARLHVKPKDQPKLR